MSASDNEENTFDSHRDETVVLLRGETDDVSGVRPFLCEIGIMQSCQTQF